MAAAARKSWVSLGHAIAKGLRRRVRRKLNYRWFIFRTRRCRELRTALAGQDFFRDADYSPSCLRYAADMFGGPDMMHVAPLDSGSVVFDAGASNGEWAEAIRKRYGCTLHCFEPNPQEYGQLLRRLGTDDKILCHPFGLGTADASVQISMAGAASSVYSDAPYYANAGRADVEVRDIARVFSDLEISRLDLLKVNIEGGEYDLMDRLLDSGLHLRCKCIRVQFHEWFDGARRRRRRIHRRLAKTHRVEWEYPFVWESWVLRRP